MLRILTAKDAPSLIQRKAARLEEAERIVAPILADIRDRGDAALLDYARKFDRFDGASVRQHVVGSLEPDFQRAVEIAANNIREYAQAQLPKNGQSITPTAAASARSCGLSMRWARTCPPAAILCRLP